MQIEAFRSRPLQSEYPFIYVDALYEKIHSNKRGISTAVIIAYGVGMDDKREILAIEPFYSESNESRTAFWSVKNQSFRIYSLNLYRNNVPVHSST